MILQSLVEYYNRKSQDPTSDIARYGWKNKKLNKLIVISEEGDFRAIEDTEIEILVPADKERSSEIRAYSLYDNPAYVLGYEFEIVQGQSVKLQTSIQTSNRKLSEKKKSFCDRLQKFVDVNPDNSELTAVQTFYKKYDNGEIQGLIFNTPNDTVTFKVEGSNNQTIIAPNLQIPSSIQSRGICLVTGNSDEIELTHGKVKGVIGATNNGTMVSFNMASASSFNKEQGQNAPVGQESVFKYRTGAEYLLRKDSKQKMVCGDLTDKSSATTIIWWSEKGNLEEDFGDYWGMSTVDNPDFYTEKISQIMTAVYSGNLPSSEAEERFYILGLGGNNGRIMIRFFYVQTVKECKENIVQYYQDLQLTSNFDEHPKLNDLLLSLVVKPKNAKPERKHILPQWEIWMLQSAFFGKMFSNSLLQQCLLRNKLENDNDKDGVKRRYQRTAIIKAIINRRIRMLRLSTNENHKELTVSLDETRTDVAYCTGRLFATLEKIQSESQNNNINATIRERFYGAASTTPKTVFGTLLKLKNHHLNKLHMGRKINFERLVTSIVANISSFPSHFNLEEQGVFAIGYYHQMQAFYTKKTTIESEQ